MNLQELPLPTAYGVVTYPAGATFGPRQMREYEFVWIIEGDTVYTQDGVPFDALQGSVVLCKPGAKDAFIWDTRKPTTHGFFHFALTSPLDFLPEPALWETVRTPCESDILTPLLLHLLHLSGETERNSEREAQCRFTLMTLLTAFVNGDATTTHPTSTPFPEPLDRALIFIRTTLTQKPESPLTLGQIAFSACVTEAHLCRLFKKWIGASPMGVVRQVRLDRAITLLTRSNYSVGEVATLCGFVDPLHFSELFKRNFDLSPSELRKRVSEGMTPPTPALFRSGKLVRG
ncbi:MAG: AraC family transcriptional regulator [Chthonomonadaceae bacterium]|nr:AraC family transcriptional regulator [Chthonomonadaceae bacterium]